MSIRELLNNAKWDRPFFKRLAHNDTIQAAGHQGGMVFPKALRRYLPHLDESAVSPLAPTVDRYLRAEMFLGTLQIADRDVRYQLQTWKGKRSAESRITEGLRPLREHAVENDLILFQRRADALDQFRLILVKQGSPEFTEIYQEVQDRRWGALSPCEVPVSQQDLLQAEASLVQLAEKPFQVIRSGEIPRVDTRQRRIARRTVFREHVRREYGRKCAVSGIAMTTPANLCEVESAHVVPVGKGGTDDFRNGLSLTKTLHWAFDRGLFGVNPERKIYIPLRVKGMPENSYLLQFENQSIVEARNTAFHVHPEAFSWHMLNLVSRWD